MTLVKTVYNFAVGGVVGVAVALLLGKGCHLISEPNDTSVLQGFALLIGVWAVLLAGGYVMVKRLFLVLVGVSLVSACTTVPAGHVAVKVNQWGTQRGVQDLPLQTGRIAYNPISEDVYVFPTYNQRVSWDSKAEDESITFRSGENSALNVDVGLNFHLQADKVPHIFLEFRQDLTTLEKGYIRDRVQYMFGRVAGRMKTFDILGPKMNDLTENVLKELQAEMAPKGIIVSNVSILGKPRVDPAVEQAINGVIAAQQQATAAEQRVRQFEAEAAQQVAKARGQAESMLAVAKGEAEANRIVNDSLNERLIQYRTLGKWNGALPQVTGGATPLITIK